MWFSLRSKARRQASTRVQREKFRPRLEALEDRCLLSAGALDTTFGGALAGSNSPAGTVLGPSGINPPYENNLAVYPNTGANPATDNKIVVGYSSRVSSNQRTSYYAFALTRYNPSGSIDTSFGSNGVVSTPIYVGQNADLEALALQSDGKLVAVGAAFDGTYSNFVVARFTADGRLDSSANDLTSPFGTNGSGIVTTHVVVPGTVVDHDYAYAVAIHSDGKICVCGTTQFSLPSGKKATFAGSDMVLVRFNANGSLDTNFGSGGVAVTPHQQGSVAQNIAYSMAIQADGKIVIAGATDTSSSSDRFMVARYTNTGVLDSASFGNGGIVTINPTNAVRSHARGILVQNDGGIILSGTSWDANNVGHETLARVYSNGSLDTNFGSSGYVVSPYLLYGHNILQAANGDLVVAGAVGPKDSDPSDDFAVAAYLPNGAPDTSFGPNGTGSNVAAITNLCDEGSALAVQSDGKLVVSGFSYNSTTSTTSVALARFLPPATKITSFTAAPNPVSTSNSVTLSASGILNSNPTTTIIQVAFYYFDNNAIKVVLSASQTSPGVWTYSAPSGLTDSNAVPLPSGTYTLYAQATDSNGVFSDPVALTLTVN
jgi:uncharacterized delta-60 repeat protein